MGQIIFKRDQEKVVFFTASKNVKIHTFLLFEVISLRGY